MTTSLSDLLAQKATLERQIAEAQRRDKTEAIASVRKLMAEHGLTMTDIAARASGPQPNAGVRAKVAAKYRNAATGDSWTGRGLKPKWLTAALAAGKTLEEFAV